MNKNGIYEMTCSECGAYYIGITTRTFEQKIKEYLRILRLRSSFNDSHVGNNLFEQAKDFVDLKYYILAFIIGLLIN